MTEDGAGPAWTPVAAAMTLTDRVYAALRQRIATGQLAPGESIREAEVASALGVSRTPLREACARLATECFLERLPNRGYRVAVESPQDLLDLYPIVSSLEVLAAKESIPRLTGEDVASLRIRNDEMKAAGEREDWRAMFEANNRFHHELSSRCRNDRLCKLLDDLRVQVASLELWSAARRGDRERAFAEHERILAAIDVGKFDDALTLLGEHRLATFTTYLTEVGAPAAP